MNTDFFTLLAQFFTTGNFGRITLSTFLINVVFVWIIIHFLYFRRSHRRDFYFTFMLLGITIYFLVYFMIYVLEDLKGKTGIGIGIGLFGIFSIMRYRTDAMPVREMTYLFTIICMSVINALGSTISFAEQLIPNIIILLAIGLCEGLLLRGKEMSKLVQYDRIELIKPERHDELLADLQERTGLEIKRIDVGAIDFLRDMAMLKIYYTDPGVGASDDAVNHQSKITRQEWEDVNQN
ncbi:MAG: DUF4956 domain-containing protein [Muribaculaceae bacterium]|nr:DUF4956 domain-containing protein [Muribaculaceae bacterium]